MSNINKTATKSTWKVADILGFEVIDQDGNNLGLLVNVLATGTNDIWTIKSDTEELLIPALKNIVKKVDMSKKRIVVSLPDGYVDAYGTKVKLEDVAVLEEFSGFTVYED